MSPKRRRQSEGEVDPTAAKRMHLLSTVPVSNSSAPPESAYPPSRLLDLPGGSSSRYPTSSSWLTLLRSEEIRNDVYSFCVEDHKSKLSKFPRAAHRDPARIHSRNPSLRRQWIGLSQVNQQIRNEFIPMYMANNSVRITAAEMQGFIDTFFPTSEVEHMGRYQGNFTVHLGEWCEKHAQPTTVDILPLIELCMRAPKLVVNLNSGRQSHRGTFAHYAKDEIARLLAKVQSLGSYQFAHPEPRIAKVELQLRAPVLGGGRRTVMVGSHPLVLLVKPCIKIVFKPKYLKPWMDGQPRKPWGRKTELDLFLDQVGLGDLRYFDVKIDASLRRSRRILHNSAKKA